MDFESDPVKEPNYRGSRRLPQAKIAGERVEHVHTHIHAHAHMVRKLDIYVRGK